MSSVGAQYGPRGRPRSGPEGPRLDPASHPPPELATGPRTPRTLPTEIAEGTRHLRTPGGRLSAHTQARWVSQGRGLKAPRGAAQGGRAQTQLGWVFACPGAPRGRNSTWLGCACPRPVGLTRAWRPSRTKVKIACFACPPQQLRELLREVDRERAHGHDTAAPGHVDDAMCHSGLSPVDACAILGNQPAAASNSTSAHSTYMGNQHQRHRLICIILRTSCVPRHTSRVLLFLCTYPRCRISLFKVVFPL